MIPKLAPVATGLGKSFISIELTDSATNKTASRRDQLMALKQIQEYQIKPLLRATRGVAEVNTSGGYDKQIIIHPDPARLTAAGMSVSELADRLSESSRNAGGGLVEIGGEQIVIRANSRVTQLGDISRIPLKFGGSVKPMLVGGVATVEIGAAYRTGASTDDGEEALVGAAIMLTGETSRIVATATREARRDSIETSARHPHSAAL